MCKYPESVSELVLRGIFMLRKKNLYGFINFMLAEYFLKHGKSFLSPLMLKKATEFMGADHKILLAIIKKKLEAQLHGLNGRDRLVP